MSLNNFYRTVILTAAIMTQIACNPGNKKNAAVPANNDAMAGVLSTSTGDASNGCTFINATYSCRENGIIGPTVTFINKQDMCTKLMDANTAINGSISFSIRSIAAQVQQCIGANNIAPNTGNCPTGYIFNGGVCTQQTTTSTTTQDSLAFKNVTCRVAARDNRYSGDSDNMKISVVPGNIGSDVWAYTAHTTNTWIKFTRTQTSNSIARVNVRYLQKTGKEDRLQLTVFNIRNEKINTVVTGFAGSDVQLSIGDFDNDTENGAVLVNCKSDDKVSLGVVTNYYSYKCSGSESIDGAKPTSIKIAIPFNEESFQTPIQISDQTQLVFDGSLAPGAGSLFVSQTSQYKIDFSIGTQTNLGTFSSVNISRVGYKLDLKCKPDTNRILPAAPAAK